MEKKITIKNKLCEIDKITHVVLEIGESHKLTDEEIYAVRLSVEEIVANIISYAFNDETEHTIAVSFSLDDRLLSMTVVDDGRPFNPLDAQSPKIDIPFESREIGGVGIYIVRHLMDELVYNYDAGKNVLIMKKYLVINQQL